MIDLYFLEAILQPPQPVQYPQIMFVMEYWFMLKDYRSTVTLMILKSILNESMKIVCISYVLPAGKCHYESSRSI